MWAGLHGAASQLSYWLRTRSLRLMSFLAVKESTPASTKLVRVSSA